MAREITIDTVRCNDCGSCIAVSPEVFVKNIETGAVDVVVQNEIDYRSVLEAINICPSGCIVMEET